MRIYLAGPMSNIPQLNFPAFDAAAADLRSRGYDVVSPAELDDPEDRAAALASPDGNMAKIDKTWGHFLARDVKLIADEGIEAIVCLPGWRESRGARLETFVGRLCELPILEYREGDSLHGAYAHEIDEAHAWRNSEGADKVYGFYEDVDDPTPADFHCAIDVAARPGTHRCQAQCASCRTQEEPADVTSLGHTTGEVSGGFTVGDRVLHKNGNAGTVVKVEPESPGNSGPYQNIVVSWEEGELAGNTTGAFNVNLTCIKPAEPEDLCDYVPGPLADLHTGFAAEAALVRTVGTAMCEEMNVPLYGGEVRITDPNTGGQKGQKLAQIGALDPLALLEVGKVAGFGAQKYDRFNFAKGYKWSLSYDALQRHLMDWAAGAEADDESGLSHLGHAAWHCLALLTFVLRERGTDDRLHRMLEVQDA
jgi:hypothetical protein